MMNKDMPYKAKKCNGEWLHGYYIKVGVHNYIATGHSAGFYGNFEMNGVLLDTLCRSTGLLYNDNIIWENDVIKIKHDLKRCCDDYYIPCYGYGIHRSEHHNYYYQNYVVKYEPDRAGFILLSDVCRHNLNSAYLERHEAEIIGNIVDDPELLITNAKD